MAACAVCSTKSLFHHFRRVSPAPDLAPAVCDFCVYVEATMDFLTLHNALEMAFGAQSGEIRVHILEHSRRAIGEHAPGRRCTSGF